MDTSSISATAAAALTVLQPYLSVIAAKAAEKIGQELPAVVGKLWNAIKTRFDNKQMARETLKDLLKKPDDPDLQAAFRVQLKKALEEDHAFAQELRRLVEEADPGTSYQVRDGALAVGKKAKAVGKGGRLIEGRVKRDVLGSGAKKEQGKKP